MIDIQVNINELEEVYIGTEFSIYWDEPSTDDVIYIEDVERFKGNIL